LALLDVLYSNDWKRPLCFSLTCAAASYKEWQGHLALEGIVYRVLAEKLSRTSWSHMTVNTGPSLDLWLRKFDFKAKAAMTEYDRTPFYMTQLVAGFALANILAEQGDYVNARTVALLLDTYFTNDMQARGYNWLALIGVLGQSNEPVIAERIGIQIVENYASSKLSEYEMNNSMVLLSKLDQLAREYGLEKLKKQLAGVK
jgi:hypothetical protein